MPALVRLLKLAEMVEDIERAVRKRRGRRPAGMPGPAAGTERWGLAASVLCTMLPWLPGARAAG